VTTNPNLDVMGAAEIARHLGVSRQRVQQLVRTAGFPAPAASLDMGKIWDAAEIREWAKTYAPKTRR
jgi:predicted DNA-binding transcriptional regulator AlpA